MAFIDNYANDLDFVPDPLTIVLTVVRNGAEFTDTIEDCKKLNGREIRQIFGAIALSVNNRGFMIPNNGLVKTDTIKPRDIIRTGGVKYIIDNVEQVHFDHQWIVICTIGKGT